MNHLIPERPRTPNAADELRQLIVTGLARHLKCPPDAVDTNAALSTFALSSLEGMILLGDLETRSGQEIDADVFSDETTIEDLVMRLEAGKAETDSSR